MPTMSSGRNSFATASPASTCSVVGFSSTPSKRATVRPAASSESIPRCAWPAATIPGSLTTRTRCTSSPARHGSRARQLAGAEHDPRRALEVEREHGGDSLPLEGRVGEGGGAGNPFLAVYAFSPDLMAGGGARVSMTWSACQILSSTASVSCSFVHSSTSASVMFAAACGRGRVAFWTCTCVPPP